VQRDLGGDHPSAAKLQEIETAGWRANDLAQRLLAFAQDGVYELVKLDLNQIVRETIQAQERSIPQRIHVTLDLKDQHLCIKADRAQLEMLLTSLCTNAIEAVVGNGEIRIATRNLDVDDSLAGEHPGLEPGRYVLLSVEDTGSGMNEETREKAFEPFFSTKFQGRGMGLAAVYGIVKKHGGYITMASQEEEGTTCTVYLPVVEAEVKPQPPAATGEAKTILLVDDEPFILNIGKEMLKSLGYQVLAANSGQAAVDIARDYEGDIHLVLLDMGMPIMDGPTTFSLLREVRPDIEVLIFSGYAMDADVQDLLEAGARGFLQKPVRFKRLQEEIHQLLGN
jgi:CheY-like chemotaxis protein